MKLKLTCGWLLLAGLPIVFTACDKDDDPDPPAGITFEIEEQEENESNGTPESFHPDIEGADGNGREIQVKIVLDRPAAEQIVLKYDVGGTADLESSGDDVSDFALSAGAGIADLDDDQLTIEKGVSEAIIIVTLYEDLLLEFDDDKMFETITLDLESVVSGPGQLGTEKTSYTLSVLEDDAVIILQWAVGGSMAVADVRTVNMDMFVWRNGQENLVNLADRLNDEFPAEQPPYEGLIIPAGFDDGELGLSYTYYSGTSDDVDFAALMFGNLEGEYYPFADDDGDYLVFEGSYTTANLNKYDETDLIPPVVQTMVKEGVNFNNISDITVPATGSRSAVTKPFKPIRQMLKEINLRTYIPSDLKYKKK